MPVIADHVARVAILIAVYGALAMAALLLVLVMRRDRKERRAAATQANDRALTREIMAALPAGGAPGEAYERASATDRLAAIAHLGQLMRGEDRARLTAFVEERHLLDKVLHKLKRRRVARRVEAVRTLGGVGGAQAIDALRETLEADRDGTARLEAAAQLAQLGALPPVGTLVEALQLDQVAVTPLHHALFRALAPQRAEELRALLAQPVTPAIRALLVDALGWTEDYSALPALGEAAGDPDPEVRLEAVRAGARLDHPAAAPWIVALLDDGDEQVRCAAVRACSTMGLRSALPAIEALRGDPSAWVRLSAREAAAVLQGAA
ncbi:HEAT repeat domain-containing protein [Sphingomonas sp. Sphisp140]|uniref:HEAT repeat domain-containing protein n=1 Tax=unclassified Sphingomonas TaxID=196159 RepID=UPI0039AF70EC